MLLVITTRIKLLGLSVRVVFEKKGIQLTLLIKIDGSQTKILCAMFKINMRKN